MALHVIQIGMGGWGRSWARIVRKSKNIKPVAYVDLATANLAAIRDELNVPKKLCFQSFEQAMSSVEADAVLITTFLESHVPLALAALEKGKHVLLEKPFAPNLEEARKANAAARKNKRILMISQNYRFHPAPIAVRKLLAKGTLGAVGSVYIDFRRYVNDRPKEHKHYALWHPLLVDMSIHHFDLMRMVLNQEPTRIECRTWNPPWSRFKIAPAGAATIDFDGGATVNYRGSWISTDTQTNWSGEWRVECEKGMVAWTSRGDLEDHAAMRRVGGELKDIRLPKLTRIDREGCLTAFARAIEKAEPVDTSGEDNVNTLDLMFAAVKAADAGWPVELGK